MMCGLRTEKLGEIRSSYADAYYPDSYFLSL
jgi:hypothetical protein